MTLRGQRKSLPNWLKLMLCSLTTGSEQNTTTLLHLLLNKTLPGASPKITNGKIQSLILTSTTSKA